MPRIFVAFLIGLIIASSLVGISKGAESKLGIDMSTDKTTYFLNDVVNVTYFVYSSNGREVGGGIGKWYLNSSNDNTNLANGTVSYGHGYFKINLGNCNITQAAGGTPYFITLVYNYENQTVSKSKVIYIMEPESMWFNLYSSPLSGGYYPESYVKITIKAPVGNLSVDYLRIEYNGSLWKNVENLALNKYGEAAYTFQIPADWKPNEDVNVSAKIINASRYVNFKIQRYFGIYLQIQGESNAVISGDDITIAAISQREIDSPYYHFYVRTQQGEMLYRFYTFQNYTIYHVPASFSGFLVISCEVFNSTEKIGEIQKTIYVGYSEMKVYFNRENYHDGGEFGVLVYFRSNVMKNPTFIYEIYESYGSYMVHANTVMSNKKEIKVEVPENAPDYYRVVVKAVSGIYTAATSGTIRKANFISLTSQIITKSVYATGVFTPGQSIEIQYSISGKFKMGILYYGFGDQFYTSPQIKYVNHSENGYLSFKIPDNINSGIHVFHIKLVYDGGEVEKDVLVNVDANPPWSQYLIFTIPAADFLTLVILATLVIFSIIYIKYPRKEKNEKNIVEEKQEIKDEILDEENL